ncbi:hypothetical protein [Methylorubrum aminovorans]
MRYLAPLSNGSIDLPDDLWHAGIGDVDGNVSLRPTKGILVRVAGSNRAGLDKEGQRDPEPHSGIISVAWAAMAMLEDVGENPNSPPGIILLPGLVFISNAVANDPKLIFFVDYLLKLSIWDLALGRGCAISHLVQNLDAGPDRSPARCAVGAFFLLEALPPFCKIGKTEACLQT